MKFYLVVVICLFVVVLMILGFVVYTARTQVKKAFSSYGIVPDIISVPPRKSLTVNYPSGAFADLGAELTPTQVKDMPRLVWECDEDDLYTLIMTDPDAPSRTNQMLGEVRHWLVVNIPGNNIDAGQTIVEYVGSGPSEGTGLHRYIFLVYKQSKRIEYEGPVVSIRSTDGRLNTKAREFAEKYELGDPVAGNFYQAQYDDYSRILQAQLNYV